MAGAKALPLTATAFVLALAMSAAESAPRVLPAVVEDQSLPPAMRDHCADIAANAVECDCAMVCDGEHEGESSEDTVAAFSEAAVTFGAMFSVLALAQVRKQASSMRADAGFSQQFCAVWTRSAAAPGVEAVSPHSPRATGDASDSTSNSE